MFKCIILCFREQAIADKLEKKELLQKEEEELEASCKTQKNKYRKTRGNISKQQAKYMKTLKKQLKQQEKERMGLGELKPNMNHVMRDEMLKAQAEGKDYVSVTGMEGALEATEEEKGVDRHPEKRRKAVSIK